MSVRPGNGAIAKAEGYADGIIDRLDAIVERTEQRNVRDQKIYIHKNAQALAADVFIEVTAPLGTIWLVERIFLAGTINTQTEAFLDDDTPANRVEYIALDGLGVGRTEPADCRVYVPPGRTLIFHFAGQTVGGTCSINMRVRELITEE